MAIYKHLVIKPETYEKIRTIKYNERIKTDDELINKLLTQKTHKTK